MKKLYKRILIGLVCGIGLLAATMTTTVPTATARPIAPECATYSWWTTCGPRASLYTCDMSFLLKMVAFYERYYCAQ
jgi:hypothetical protein